MATPQLLGSRVGSALGTLGRADPHWLWVAAIAFTVSLIGSAGCWRSAIGLCGGGEFLPRAAPPPRGRPPGHTVLPGPGRGARPPPPLSPAPPPRRPPPPPPRPL